MSGPNVNSKVSKARRLKSGKAEPLPRGKIPQKLYSVFGFWAPIDVVEAIHSTYIYVVVKCPT